MGKDFDIYKYCNKCNRTGVVSIVASRDDNDEPIFETVVCDDCLGNKKTLWGEIIKT